eukprot:6708999-Ditylum_brightwellii.AAC.1
MPEEENDPNHKHSQVLFQKEKIKNLTHSRLPSTEEDSNVIDHKSMGITWHNYVEEVGYCVEEDEEE